MRTVTINIEDCFRADETDRVASVLRDMFRRDLLKARLTRMDEAGLGDYFRQTKPMKGKNRPFSLLKALRYLIP